jgi:nucleoside-diphosphate-sugar epimerase
VSKVFITGGTGFIGSHLVDKLLAKGYQIKCMVRKSSNLKWLADKNIELVYCDFFNEQLITQAVEDVDYIYHIAGVTFAKSKEDFFRGNVEATKSLLKVILKVNPSLKKFIHLSSQAAVGPSPDREHPVKENALYKPISTYGRSKMEAEIAVKEYFGKLNITIVRPPAVFGPRDIAVYEYFKTMSKGLQPMIGFNDKLVSLIHASDLVDGIILAGESDVSNNNIYFISSEQFYSWKEVGIVTEKIMLKKSYRLRIPHALVFTVGFFAEIFAHFSKKPAILNMEKCRELTQNYWTCSVEKAKRELGYKQKLTLEDSIRDTVDWYFRNKWIKLKKYQTVNET